MRGRQGPEGGEKRSAKRRPKDPEQYRTRYPANTKYDPADPSTWPLSVRKQVDKIFYLLDALVGESKHGSPKGRYLDKVFEDKDVVHVAIYRDMMEVIADIEGMYKMGGFGNVPLVVAEKWADRYSKSKIPFTPDQLDSGNLSDRPWTPTAVIRLSLDVFRYYLMGTCPMTRKVIKKVMRANDRPITLHQIANAVERAGDFEAEVEVDDY